jgi:hypothetical protein
MFHPLPPAPLSDFFYHMPCQALYAHVFTKNATNFFSLNGEDLWLYQNIFHNTRNATFVEMGGYHPFRGSNSWYFEKCMNWSGVVVEPQASLRRPFEHSKRKAHIDSSCIAEHVEKVDFLSTKQGSGVGGVVNNRGNHVKGFLKVFDPGVQTEHLEMVCVPMQRIFDSYGLVHVDYFSLDCEGCELSAVKSIDFDRTSIDVFTVEGSNVGKDAVEFLKTKGYAVIHRLNDDFVLQKSTAALITL